MNRWNSTAVARYRSETTCHDARRVLARSDTCIVVDCSGFLLTKIIWDDFFAWFIETKHSELHS
jgi:hypothetical protein